MIDSVLQAYSNIPMWQIYLVVCALLAAIWFAVWFIIRIPTIAFASIFLLSVLAYLIELLPFRSPPFPIVTFAIMVINFICMLCSKSKTEKRKG